MEGGRAAGRAELLRHRTPDPRGQPAGVPFLLRAVCLRRHGSRGLGAAGAGGGAGGDLRRGRAVSGLDCLGCLLVVRLGSGWFAVAWQGGKVGELPAGPSFCGTRRPTREDNPLAFHVFFVLYVCGGTAVVVWGLLALVGMAPPPKWA